jgi:transglutaminase-like putative cysteine protease
MRITIDYQTQYAYAEPVSFSAQLFRLFPKTGRHLTIHRLNFQTNAGADVQYRHDLFDNEVASVFYPGKSALLQASLQIDLDVQERNPFGFILASHAVDFPFTYSTRERDVLAPYLRSDNPLSLPFWTAPSVPESTVSTLVSLNAALHENIAYERRDEGAAYAAEETLRFGRGSCRDYAVLLAEVARGIGVAARLASGFLCEFEDGRKVADGAMHAWTELYLPGAGWIGFDPTNGYLCNHYHLTAAVGLIPEDITPILGTFSPPLPQPPLMAASLHINPA